MDTLVTMSFPGLGIGEFTVNKVAFSLFGRDVRWYGIVITLGMLFAVFYALYRCKMDGFTLDDVVDLALCVIVPGVLGARIYYVLNTLGQGKYQSFYDVIAIWNGGLAIYGGIIGGAIGLIICCLVKKKNPLAAFDFAAPGCMVAQAMGRWGNFFNGEAYGGLVSEDSFLYYFRMGLSPNDFTGSIMAYVHPTFLYESLWNLLGFIWINATYKRRKFRGQIFFSYLAWYGFGRFWIEQLRTDSLYLGNTNIRISQWVGFLCFFGALIVLIAGFIKSGKKKNEPTEPVDDTRAAAEQAITSREDDVMSRVADTEQASADVAAAEAATVNEAESVETTNEVGAADAAEAALPATDAEELLTNETVETVNAAPDETAETVSDVAEQAPSDVLETAETVESTETADTTAPIETIETVEPVETVEPEKTEADEAEEIPEIDAAAVITRRPAATIRQKAADTAETDEYDDASEGDGATAEELTSAIQRFMFDDDDASETDKK